jgi:hypothetical protein
MSGVVAATTYVKISSNNQFSFGDFMDIGTGIVGEAVVGAEDAVSETFSNPLAVDIRRGRELALDTYNTGSASVTVIDSGTWNPLIVTGLWADKIVPGIQMKVWAEYPSTMLSCSGGAATTPYLSTYVPSVAKSSIDVRIAFVVTAGLEGQYASLANLAYSVNSGDKVWDFSINYGQLLAMVSLDGNSYYEFYSSQLPQFEIGTTVALRMFFDGNTGRVSFYYWETSPTFAYDITTNDPAWTLINTAEVFNTTPSVFWSSFTANGYLLRQSSVADLAIGYGYLLGQMKFNVVAFCLETVSPSGTATVRSSFDMTDGLKTLGASTFSDNQSHTWTLRTQSLGTPTVSSVQYKYPLFAGYISSYDWQWTKGVTGQNTVTFNAEDAFRPLNMVELETVAGANANDLPGARMTQILNEVAYPTAGLSIATGSTQLQDDEGTVRTVLPLLQAIAESDLGSFYTDKTGFVKFEDRNTIARRLLSPFIRFSDVPSIEGYDYQVFDVSYDDSLIANDVSVDSGGDVQQATDATSIAKYFKRSMSKTGLLMENDTDALLMAQTILSSRKDPTVRITNIGVDITKAPSIKDQRELTSVLGTEFGQPIIVTKNWYQVDPTFIGFNPTTISDLLTVQGISHTIRPDRWVVEFITAQPLLSSFILDDSSNGEFGDILYY